MSMIDCRSVASTRTNTAGVPFTSETMSSSTKPSRTRATSPSVTMVPSSSRDERNVLELLADAALGDGVQHHAPGLGAQLPERQVEGCALHRGGHLGGRQVVAPQLLLAELDCYLPVTRARSVTSEMGRQLQQFAAHVFGRQSQLVLARDRRRDGERHRLDGQPRQLYLWPFRVLRREVLDGVHRIPHSVQYAVCIGEGRDFDPDEAHAFGGGGHDPLYTARPTTLSSTRRTMSCSTSRGDEPGDGTVTVTVRRSMAGSSEPGAGAPTRARPR